MSRFRLFTGNRLETLSEVLADILKTPLTSPLEPEIFVVQSSGMERWISMEIARYLGVSANNRFLYPNTFIYEMMTREMMTRIVPLEVDRPGFSPDVMTWQIMKLLPVCLEEAAFEEIRHYLGDSRLDRKTYQLAAKIADIFDQYLLFRPEMIFKWEDGEEDVWQAVLWRKLISENKTPHRAALLKIFLENLNARMSDRMSDRIPDRIPGRIKFPERIMVFGISALPQFHMNILEAISRISEVNLFLINPCREFWGDTLSDREIKKASGKTGTQGVSRSLLYLEQGNRILSDLGILGRDFFDLIQEIDCEIEEFIEDPGEENLLSCIQSDILNLVHRSDKEGKKIIRKADHSIMINSCHSPVREVETLYDNLLNMFDEDPSLRPGDILVMTPDIEIYAPYIQAVFDVPVNEGKRIPYSIADRTVLNESSVIRAFNLLLGLSGSRFGVSKVLSFLEAAPVREKFGFSKNDLRLIGKWVSDTGIRWGIDAGHRGKMDLPEFEENTWSAGLKQLVLGYAMSPNQEKVFHGILPYDGVEGENAIVMGRFVNFAEKLFKTVSAFEIPRTPAEWSDILQMILDDFFKPDNDTQRDFQAVRRAADGLKEVTEAAGFNKAIGLDVIQQHLTGLFEKQGFGFGFLEGGVTFCAMVPMRSIPFKVICLIGMNSDAYPRQTRSPGFDLIAKIPRKGDRSRRNDDQYLFLESILSARQILYISYVGQSRIDNTPILPAVPVSGFLEYIDDNFEVDDITMRKHMVTTHRLQAFNPEYFNQAGELFSYSGENCRISENLLKDTGAVEPFITSSPVKPDDILKTANLEDLVRFYSNPSESFVKTRLGIYFEKPIAALEEKEVFRIDPLDRYFLEQELVEAALGGRDPSDLMDAFRAAGRLPHGNAGEIVFTKMCNGALNFAEKVLSFSQGESLEPVLVNLNISGFHLTGKVDRIYSDRIVMYRNAITKAKDLLGAWIYHLALSCHLALNCTEKDKYPDTSVFVGKNEKRETIIMGFPLVEDSCDFLGQLLEHYWQGLASPMHFFPETSLSYAKQIDKNKTTKDALRGARNKWEGSNFSPGESVNSYYELCFRG
ncbi:MAG: exodeoxyribonuclease V subunit gamma, partial [Deltaproteobacteria bacterium]|nr:exodeoxyribonuclease V subunit gamma [Deltaproteobacteria bacterium]